MLGNGHGRAEYHAAVVPNTDYPASLLPSFYIAKGYVFPIFIVFVRAQLRTLAVSSIPCVEQVTSNLTKKIVAGIGVLGGRGGDGGSEGSRCVVVAVIHVS